MVDVVFRLLAGGNRYEIVSQMPSAPVPGTKFVLSGLSTPLESSWIEFDPVKQRYVAVFDIVEWIAAGEPELRLRVQAAVEAHLVGAGWRFVPPSEIFEDAAFDVTAALAKEALNV